MTNREVLIHELTIHSHDADLSAADYIECPYFRDDDCKNTGTGFKATSYEYNENCRQCKADWLDKEWEE